MPTPWLDFIGHDGTGERFGLGFKPLHYHHLTHFHTIPSSDQVCTCPNDRIHTVTDDFMEERA